MFDPEDDSVEFMRKVFIVSNILNDNKEKHIEDDDTATQPIESNKKTIRKCIIEFLAILILILMFFFSI